MDQVHRIHNELSAWHQLNPSKESGQTSNESEAKKEESRSRKKKTHFAAETANSNFGGSHLAKWLLNPRDLEFCPPWRLPAHAGHQLCLAMPSCGFDGWLRGEVEHLGYMLLSMLIKRLDLEAKAETSHLGLECPTSVIQGWRVSMSRWRGCIIMLYWNPLVEPKKSKQILHSNFAFL